MHYPRQQASWWRLDPAEGSQASRSSPAGKGKVLLNLLTCLLKGRSIPCCAALFQERLAEGTSCTAAMSMMDPDVEFFGVEIPPSDLVSVEEHLETDDATYASIHATQVLHWRRTTLHCYSWFAHCNVLGFIIPSAS